MSMGRTVDASHAPHSAGKSLATSTCASVWDNEPPSGEVSHQIRSPQLWQFESASQAGAAPTAEHAATLDQKPRRVTAISTPSSGLPKGPKRTRRKRMSAPG